MNSSKKSDASTLITDNRLRNAASKLLQNENNNSNCMPSLRNELRNHNKGNSLPPPPPLGKPLLLTQFHYHHKINLVLDSFKGFIFFLYSVFSKLKNFIF